ncbi:hypothetical protein GCM10009858_16010 [Terrabacter carboxydivorans]|uniref:Uncharacterized protein n=1 Tax=Terrabacter carboxydivorans TaxID=619730 RepID=A0ABN3L7N4_9MICO
MPMACTVPKIVVRDPVGRICACRPFLRLARSALATWVCTTHAFVEMTETAAEPVDDPVVLAAPPEPEAPDPPDPPDPPAPPVPRPEVDPAVEEEPPVPPEPPTVEPTLTFTAATTPSMGEVSRACYSDCCAATSLA